MYQVSRLLSVSVLTAAMMLSSATFAQKALKIGVEGAYPPFSSMDKNGRIVGFDIDIAKALCDQMQRHCQLVKVDWDGMIPALKARKIDAIIASMLATGKRKKAIDFTAHYYNAPSRFIRKKGANVTYSKPGMQGKVIGVQVATAQEQNVRDVFAQVSDIKTYNTNNEALLDLQAGRVDAVIAGALVLEEFLSKPQGQGFEFFGPKLSDEKYYGKGVAIGIRKNSNKLKAAFNAAIKAIRSNGIYKTINDQYFSFDIYGE